MTSPFEKPSKLRVSGISRCLGAVLMSENASAQASDKLGRSISIGLVTRGLLKVAVLRQACVLIMRHANDNAPVICRQCGAREAGADRSIECAVGPLFNQLDLIAIRCGPLG